MNMVLPKLTIKRQEWKNEIIGILFLGLAIFLLLALLSYSPLDPSFNHSGGGEIANLGGRSGAMLADLLLQTVGGGALVLPLYLVGIFVGLVGGRGYPHWSSLLGALGLIICVAIWSTLLMPTLILQKTEVLAGGALGDIVANLLLDFFNPIGTYLMMTVAIASALIVATNISPLKVALLIASAMLWTGNYFLRTITGVAAILRRQLARITGAAKKKNQVAGSADKPSGKKEAKIRISRPPQEKPVAAPTQHQGNLPFLRERGRINLPNLNLLHAAAARPKKSGDHEALRLKSRQLENKLKDYGVTGEVVEVHPGPVVTMFEFQPAAGIKLSKISSLADDLALAMSAMSVRIVAPIPGKAVVGIEIPNLEREDVNFKDLLLSAAYQQSKSMLPLALGKEIDGAPLVADLTKMPHLLIAGSTGSGKSVGINCLICSILFKVTPDFVKFIMVDPKRLELSVYDHIPHLLLPVVTNPKKAAAALGWAVEEMERRYSLMSLSGTRNIASFNRYVEKQLALRDSGRALPKPVEGDQEESSDAEEPILEKLPFIVIIIDELADLMMVASKEVEESITRLAQMARAAGIHLILATQRPSVDVITGLIKANFPARISFRVSSKIDSRTILDASGAEHLLGNGDMLLLNPGTSVFTRLHGAFISDEEIKALTDFLRSQGTPEYEEDMLKKHEAALAAKAKGRNGARSAAEVEEGLDEDGYDELYDQAVALVARSKGASASMIQRQFKIGYNRASRIIETMEREGVVGPAEGSKLRKVLISPLEG